MGMTGGKWREGTLRQNDGSVAILDEHNARICRVDAGPGSTHAQAISQLPALVALVKDMDRLLTKWGTVAYDARLEANLPFGLADELKAYIREDKPGALLRAMGEG